jgi:hypothetical protein
MGNLIDQSDPLYNLFMQLRIDGVNLVTQAFQVGYIVRHCYDPSDCMVGPDGGDTRTQ